MDTYTGAHIMSRTLERPPVEEGREAWQEGGTSRPEVTQSGDYVPFGNVETRNGLQAWVEIPLMLHALRLPHRARVLEIGCGRGVALPVLDDRLEPAELVGIDID